MCDAVLCNDKHPQHAQVGAWEQQLQVKRHSAYKIDDAVKAEDIFFATLPRGAAAAHVFFAVRPNAQHIFDRKHCNTKNVKSVELIFESFMNFRHRFQDDANHVGYHQQGDENFNKVAVFVRHFAFHDFVCSAFDALIKAGGRHCCVHDRAHSLADDLFLARNIMASTCSSVSR